MQDMSPQLVMLQTVKHPFLALKSICENGVLYAIHCLDGHLMVPER